MGETLSKLFVPLTSLPDLYKLPEVCVNEENELDASFFGISQLLFLALVYGYILYQSSQMIADGSELLLLIPSVAPVVGSIVLPVLGAVPDGAIILFSGLGERSKAQQQLTIGVGALAGSTVMLLTVPWVLSIVAGKVDIDENGHCQYSRPNGVKKSEFKKYTGTKDPFVGVGVSPTRAPMRSGAIIMAITSIPYLVIQGAAFGFHGESDEEVAKNEHYYALFGLLFCLVFFFIYLYRKLMISEHDEVLADIVDETRATAMRNGSISLKGAFYQVLSEKHLEDEGTRFMSDDVRFRGVVKKFFSSYDKNGDGVLNNHELRYLLIDLGMPHNEEDVQDFMKHCDHDESGDINFDEFLRRITELVVSSDNPHNHHHHHHEERVGNTTNTTTTYGTMMQEEDNDDDEEEEEEEEMPEDLQHLPPNEQQKRIIIRSLRMMGIGSIVILLFSDPMVDVLDTIGKVLGVPGFYVSFILCPLASNASEFLAAYGYALRKTSKTVTISLTSLLGAAIMNNTFGLGIFLSLVYFRELTWSFSAETICILFVEFAMVYVALQPKQTMRTGLFVISLFPLSIGLVSFLENVVGLD